MFSLENLLKFNIKRNLLIASFLLVVFLIWFFNIGLLPFKGLGDFIFFAILAFALALYRPGWAFLFFIGTIAIENITLIPKEIGLMLRPYQLLGALILVAILIRFFAKRLNFALPKLKWHDLATILIGLASFLSITLAADKFLSFKLAVVVCSFIFLYFLTRIFIQDIGDVSKIVSFFLISSWVIVLYGIWQNISFLFDKNSFEVMPGRPNATFLEPDWLGMFLVFLLSGIFALLFNLCAKKKDDENYNLKKISYFLSLIIVFVLLIITVSRSAWLGATIVIIFFLIATIFSEWKIFWRQLGFITLSFFLSLLIVYIFHLTNFQLFNRAQSTASGLQKITVACTSPVAAIPEKIENISELEQYGCKHINLEDINQERDLGYEIREIYRTDPNVNIRSEIYKKSWEQIKAHPVLGIGWGNINNILGKDERGAGLNSSNMFLEIWLGSGIIGLIAFLLVWMYILLKSVYVFFKTDDIVIKVFALFVAISWLGLTAANLFNAGIMLGFLWVYLAIGLIDYKTNENRY